MPRSYAEDASPSEHSLDPNSNGSVKQVRTSMSGRFLFIFLRKDEKTMTTVVGQELPKSWAQTPPITPPLRHALAQVVENQRWLEQLAKPFQQWILPLFGQSGESRRKLKDALNGTWLGHPLHPVFTDVPLGSWSGTLLFDLCWLVKKRY